MTSDIWQARARAQDILATVVRVIDDVQPLVVIEHGTVTPCLADLLAEHVLETCGEVGTVLSSHAGTYRSEAAAARPSSASKGAIASTKAVVVLSGAGVIDAFMWASVLDAPGSALVLIDPQAVPDPALLARVACDLKPAGEGVVRIDRQERAADAVAAMPDRRPLPMRPLRSVLLGDSRYVSLYRQGVVQGMTLLGHWHRDVCIREPPEAIDRAVREMRPDVIWGHMLLWPPANGLSQVPDLLDLLAGWRRDFAPRVLIHDGDPRGRSRFPHPVDDLIDLALCNFDRPVADWRVPQIKWPYAALVQKQIGDVAEHASDLAFAGLMREDGLYGERTRCVRALQEQTRMRGCQTHVFQPGAEGNNRMQIAAIAPSHAAMIGFGRPEVPGWIDTRVFTVPGAGGVLIHDDVGGMLEPGMHYFPCVRYDADSVIEALDRAKRDARKGSTVRRAGFAHVQAHHTYRQRVQQVLDLLFRC